MEFETLLKVIVTVAGTVAIPVAAYGAIVAIRAIWIRPPAGSTGERLEEDVEALRAQVAELAESGRRLAELEERIDFAERLLVQARPPVLHQGDTPPERLPSAR